MVASNAPCSFSRQFIFYDDEVLRCHTVVLAYEPVYDFISLLYIIRRDYCSSCTFRYGSPIVATIALRKETPAVAAPKKVAPPEAPCREGSSRYWDKAVSLPQSICDLYCVWARSRDEPFFAQEMVDLPRLSGEGPLEAWWASLTSKSQVWADRVDAQLFC
ncbi:hypothetical protein B296_00034118 [Ensete ventricosum]|uniref:Uncharacterized protein n=1 Tax=Ensete ventricosum TaxID=4639 RepID=A0A427A9B0_ENSVE|nr:hypothetical protein B296_00034118 [Ensete ventricosum]